HLACAENAAVLKAYRNFGEIREVLKELDLAESSVFVSRLGLEGEIVAPRLADAPDAPHYLSLLLVKRPASDPEADQNS
ncbi:MAG: precorrin-2 C(20)-methyltransferase, partial [Desulfovibrionaceae bacterium]